MPREKRVALYERENHFLVKWHDGTKYREGQFSKSRPRARERAVALQRQMQDQQRQTGARLLSETERAEYLSAKERAGGTPLLEIVRFWEERRPTEADSAVSDALQSYVDERRPYWGADTQVDKLCKLNKINEYLGNECIKNLTTNVIKDYLDSVTNTPISYNNHLRVFKAFLNWAVKRDYIINSPANSIDSRPLPREEIGIYSPEETARIFSKAKEIDMGLTTYLALTFFAGIRPKEAPKLTPKYIREGKIFIPAHVSKTGRARRLEGLPETVFRWLEVGDFEFKNYNKRRKKIFEEAGIELLHQGARHSFCTYHWALFQNEEQTRRLSGHRSPSVFHNNYARASVLKAEGRAYFAVLPNSP